MLVLEVTGAGRLERGGAEAAARIPEHSPGRGGHAAGDERPRETAGRVLESRGRGAAAGAGKQGQAGGGAGASGSGGACYVFQTVDIHE